MNAAVRETGLDPPTALAPPGGDGGGAAAAAPTVTEPRHKPTSTYKYRGAWCVREKRMRKGGRAGQQ